MHRPNVEKPCETRISCIASRKEHYGHIISHFNLEIKLLEKYNESFLKCDLVVTLNSQASCDKIMERCEILSKS